MPGKEYWRFQLSFGNFADIYEKGQSLQTSIDKMNKVFATKPADEALLLEGIRVHFPEYTITAQDRAERSERREISAMGRETFYKLLHQRQKALERLRPGEKLERGVDMLFDLSDSPDAEAWNDRVCYLFGMKNKNYLNGTVEERSQLFMEFIDRQMKKIDVNKLYHLTDRELAKDYIQFYSIFGMLAEGGDALLGLNNSAIKIPEDYVTKLKELKWANQTQMGDLRGRFENIIDPNYEIFHLDRLRAKIGMEIDDFSDKSLEKLNDRINENLQARNYFVMMNGQGYSRWLSHFDKINNAIRQLNLPEEFLNPPVYNKNGERVASLLLDVTTLDGKPLVGDMQNDGPFLCFTNPLTKQQHFLKSDGTNYRHFDFSHMPDPLKTDAEKALRELEDADPWRIRAFTGSKEYNEMKAAMKNVAEFMQKIPKSPTKEQRDEFKLLLDDLEEKQAAYATHKGELSASTKESERARINASNIVKKYIDDASVLMDGYEKAVAVRENMHKDMKTARDHAMGKQMDAENNYQRPRNITNAREEVQYSEKVSVAYGKNLPFGDPLKDLGDDIYMNGYSDKTPDVLNTIAKMVTYDLIARERVGKKEAGPVERAYLAGPDTFIQGLENSQTLQKIAASVEQNGELKNFMNSTVGKNVQTLSDTVIEESKGRQKTASDPLMYPTQMMRNVIDAQAPVAPKRGPMGK